MLDPRGHAMDKVGRKISSLRLPWPLELELWVLGHGGCEPERLLEFDLRPWLPDPELTVAMVVRA